MCLTASLFNVIAARCPQAFRTVRHLLVGGDAVDPRWSRHVLKTAPLERIINGYGPTECTTFSVTHDIRNVPEGAKLVPIGRPLSNSQAYVLDWNLQPAPVGVPGELYLGGDGLAKGYWNRPELTAERFVPSPFDPSGQARLYKTGDLARYREDGVIECLGRTDRQVKIRGFRIELGEIETVFRQHPSVRDCAVVAGQDATGAKTLWAYVATGPGAKPGWPEVRQFLRERLPEFMLPSGCMFLDEMPLSHNGKVDRRKLPPFETTPLRRSENSAAPKTEAQQTVAGIWKKVLGVSEIGLDDNFFDVGGNSLLMAEVESELGPRFAAHFTITDLFEHPTVRTLAARLTGAEGESNPVSSAHDRALRQKMALDGLRTTARIA
jgi:non-ribosomal peptide synthetase component F